MTRWKVGSLFTGWGGLDMAVEAAFGGETAWVSDVDKGSCKVLAHRYPGVPNLGDITKIDWTRVLRVRIMTGGSPCQDLSHAGPRGGMTEGTRSNLWVSMRAGIEELRPEYVIWENVRGAYSARADSELGWTEGLLDGRADSEKPKAEKGHALTALGRVLGDLSDLGYDTQWRGLRAADVGSCHGRFRVFVVARLRDPVAHGWDDAAPDVDWTGGVDRGPALTLLPIPRTSDTNGPGVHGNGGLDLRTAVTLLPTPAVNDMGKAYTPEEWDAWTTRMKAEHANGNGHGKSLEIEAARLDLLGTPRAAEWKGCGPVGSASQQHWLDHDYLSAQVIDPSFGQYGPAVDRWGRVLGRPAPAPTVPRGKGGSHRLSPDFTEWMMGAPEGWITDVPGITTNEVLKLCGNGVVPQQAYAATMDALAMFERLDQLEEIL